MSLRHKNVLGTHSTHLTRSEREMKILQARHGSQQERSQECNQSGETPQSHSGRRGIYFL